MSKQKINSTQKNKLLDLIASKPQLRSGKFTSTFSHKDAQKQWEEIARILNAVPGANKDWKAWRKTWQDYLSKTKAKSAGIKKIRRGTGGGPPPPHSLDDFEEGVAALIHPHAVSGHTGSSESTVMFEFEVSAPSIQHSFEVPLELTQNLPQIIDDEILPPPFEFAGAGESDGGTIESQPPLPTQTGSQPPQSTSTGMLPPQTNSGVVPVFRRALLFPNRVAVQDDTGAYTYSSLYQAALDLSKEISKQLLGESRQTIAYMSSNDATHILTQWAIWMTGNIALPLTSIYPPEMLKYFIKDSHAALVICTPEHEKILGPVAKEVKRNLLVTNREKDVSTEAYPDDANPKLENLGKSNKWYGENDALIIYTSGTTSNPKGVVWTHTMLATQIASLHAAWQYDAKDVVLHTLPLHHVHGQLNSVNASLAAGARLRMLPSFTTHSVWSRLINMDPKDEAKVTVFHGVPAMYARLVSEHERMFPDPKTAQYVKQTLSKMRLMCAGSAPLPETLFRKWEEISGQRLLERYGMTEVGMALSNPYTPVEERTVGCVGVPLPGMVARIAAVNEKTGKLEPLVTVETAQPDCEISLDRLGLTNKDYFGETDAWEEPQVTKHKEPVDGVYQGELLLKGPSVFSRYYNRPPKMDDSDFVDGFFRTGDTASYCDGRFKILGRTSIDIIKTAGFKVSALQVESAILENPKVTDAAVLGVEHESYGELIAAVVSLKDSAETLTMRELKGTLGKKLAPYQLPRTLLLVDEMPRNAMGKLDKKKIKELYGKELGLKRQKA